MAQDFLAKLRREGEEREVQQKAQKSGIIYLDIATTPVQLEALSLISEEKARQFKVAPFQLKQKDLSLAVLDPDDSAVRPLIKDWESQGLKVHLYAVSRTSLEELLGHYKFVSKKAAEITGRIQIESSRLEEFSKKLISLEKIKKEIREFNFKTFATGQLLEVILAGALSNRASDIHFEAEKKDVRLRFRVDGLLHDVVPDLAKDIYKFLISRIKLLSNLKLNVEDRPQDGRFTIGLVKKEIEVRVSTAPSEYGETVVMRILDPEVIKLNLSQLGLRPDDLEIIERELKEPNGMILNTGPTGAGKTTTLYAFLLHKRKPEIKIITIEDPIEYHLEDIEQTQVDLEAGYTFVNGLRSIMRQDPDVILVGEIRDSETAGIALQSALTGHLVFSTVHANSAAGAIPRLLDLKVNSASIGPALNLVIAQRLVRRLCQDCRVAKKLSPDFQKKIDKMLKNLPKRVDRSFYLKMKVYESKGCERCGGLGYKGRIAVFELMEVNEEMENLIGPAASEAAIERQALKQEMVTMQQDGILKVISGMTTFEEVENVTGPLKF